MSQNLQALLTTAAEMRAVGHPWEAIAEKVGRRVQTCRAWPIRFRSQWERLYREAQEKRFEQTANECHTYLVNLCRDKDPKVRERGLALWLRYGATAYGRQGAMVRFPADGPGGAGPVSRATAAMAAVLSGMDSEWDAMDRDRARKGLPPATKEEFVSQALAREEAHELQRREWTGLEADAKGNSVWDGQGRLVDTAADPHWADRAYRPDPAPSAGPAGPAPPAGPTSAGPPGTGPVVAGLLLAAVLFLGRSPGGRPESRMWGARATTDPPEARLLLTGAAQSGPHTPCADVGGCEVGGLSLTPRPPLPKGERGSPALTPPAPLSQRGRGGPGG